jgi:phosphoserine phosphatase RsbX
MDSMTWQGGADGWIAWAAACRPSPGQKISGDVHVAAPFRGGMLVGVIDGLGHGHDARAAATAARDALAAAPSDAIDLLMTRCHEALRRMRGAVLSLASFDFTARRMTWLGVGNVEGVLLRRGAGGAVTRERLLTKGGVIGQTLPALRPTSLEVGEGDIMVFASDGIRATFADTLRPGGAVPDIADQLLATQATGMDDALVLCARVIGGTS